jgi:hypothetical protein
MAYLKLNDFRMKYFKLIYRKLKSFLISNVVYKENYELIYKFSHYKKCVILGTGPSINNFDLNFSESDLIISVGNFHEHKNIEKIKPHIHVFAASHPPITDDVFKEWWMRCNYKLPKETAVLVEKRNYALAIEVFKNRKIFQYSYGGQFPIDFTRKIKSPDSVSQIAMQLAIYLKISKIYFFGIDLHWQMLEPHRHFYSHDEPSLEYYLGKQDIKVEYEIGEYLSKNVMYRLFKIYQNYEGINVEAIKNGLNIYNANKYSKFDVFPYESNN